jgi:hypothetical protein
LDCQINVGKEGQGLALPTFDPADYTTIALPLSITHFRIAIFHSYKFEAPPKNSPSPKELPQKSKILILGSGHMGPSKE